MTNDSNETNPQLETYTSESVLERVKGHDFMILNFTAPWATSLKQMSHLLQVLRKKYQQKFDYVQIDSEKSKDLCRKYGVKAVPTMVFLKVGDEVGRIEGNDAKEVRKKIEEWNFGDSKNIYETLINEHPIMLFMKGSPGNERCGFSKQIVALLAKKNIQYGWFDILTDENVRQGLKKFSNWPTYPQLYANGELIGGLDIVKELDESGELEKELGLEDINKLCAKLINKAPVMVFMKGSPGNERCGFSRQMVALLKSNNVTFDSFDILSDQRVRQGLKEYSKWPTYPQLYANGELIGGLDIAKELNEDGVLLEELGLSK